MTAAGKGLAGAAVRATPCANAELPPGAATRPALRPHMCTARPSTTQLAATRSATSARPASPSAARSAARSRPAPTQRPRSRCAGTSPAAQPSASGELKGRIACTFRRRRRAHGKQEARGALAAEPDARGLPKAVSRERTARGYHTSARHKGQHVLAPASCALNRRTWPIDPTNRAAHLQAGEQRLQRMQRARGAPALGPPLGSHVWQQRAGIGVWQPCRRRGLARCVLRRALAARRRRSVPLQRHGAPRPLLTLARSALGHARRRRRPRAVAPADSIRKTGGAAARVVARRAGAAVPLRRSPAAPGRLLCGRGPDIHLLLSGGVPEAAVSIGSLAVCSLQCRPIWCAKRDCQCTTAVRSGGFYGEDTLRLTGHNRGAYRGQTPAGRGGHL